MNTRKIEPGMLCLVTKGINTGRECTTIRLIQPGQLTEPELPGFLDESAPPCWLVHGPNLETKRLSSGIGYEDGYSLALPDMLMPIQPDNHIKQTEVKRIKVPSNAKELTAT